MRKIFLTVLLGVLFISPNAFASDKQEIYQVISTVKEIPQTTSSDIKKLGKWFDEQEECTTPVVEEISDLYPDKRHAAFQFLLSTVLMSSDREIIYLNLEGWKDSLRKLENLELKNKTFNALRKAQLKRVRGLINLQKFDPCQKLSVWYLKGMDKEERPDVFNATRRLTRMTNKVNEIGNEKVVQKNIRYTNNYYRFFGLIG